MIWQYASSCKWRCGFSKRACGKCLWCRGVSSCFHTKQRSLKSPLVFICEVVSNHQFHSISTITCLYRLHEPFGRLIAVLCRCHTSATNIRRTRLWTKRTRPLRNTTWINDIQNININALSMHLRKKVQLGSFQWAMMCASVSTPTTGVLWG